MSNKDLPNLAIIDGLEEASLQALDQERYLESAIIIFQAIEFLLRMAIKRFGRNRGVTEANIKMAADREISFRRLVLYFDLVHPENNLSRRLLELNRERNSIMHDLSYDFKSIDAMHGHVKALCTNGAEVYRDLRKLVGAGEPIRGKAD